MSTRTNTAKWDGSRWCIKVQKNGTRRSFYSSTPGRTGQREANAKADAWLDGDLSDQRSKVSKIWEDYLQDVEARSGYDNWRQIHSLGKNYVLPLLGHKRVASLTEGDLQAVLNRAYKHGSFKPGARNTLKPGQTLSKKTLENIKFALTNFIAYARTTAHATTLVPSSLKVPTGARKGEKTILQADELRILMTSDMTTYRGKPKRDELIHAYRLAVLTGLRPGELIGLRWGDVAPNDVQINLRRSINIHSIETRGKNENAVRPVQLSDYARGAIAAQRTASQAAGFPIAANEPVFPISCEQTFAKYWHRYLEANNMKGCTLYELRHTFVSIASTLPAGEVKSQVGHSRNMDTFGIYGHRLIDYDQQIRQDFTTVFDRLLG